MRIGLLTDIHENVENLRWAVQILRSERVDRIIVLGDIFDTGLAIEETLEVMSSFEHQAIFGNHELGLCLQPEAETIAKYSTATIDYFATCQPTLQVADVYFSHGMPDWDPHDPLCYYIGEPIWEPSARESAFATCAHRIMFMGHFHRWAVYEPFQELPWQGYTPISLQPPARYLVVIDSVLDGSCAVFDTQSSVLTPYRRLI